METFFPIPVVLPINEQIVSLIKMGEIIELNFQKKNVGTI